jgi:hypothetical protein
MSIGILVALFLLFFFAAGEIFYPNTIREGFETLVPALSSKSSFFSSFVPKRGDVGVDFEEESYQQDGRYFRGYADVQRIGVEQDFCRMVIDKTNDEEFFACALAGTDNLASTKYRTPSVKQGLRLSRDDYMNKGAYCRILKYKDGSWQAQCNKPLDTEFDASLQLDGAPPSEIELLLTFYRGCMIWLRFRDDMEDYVKNVKVYKKGDIVIEEYPPSPIVTRGLPFNGIDQFLRIADNQDLELGALVKLRSMRAVMVWVYFDEFTNNAHIFDFGNGAGRDNILLGILGKGDQDINDAGILRPPLLCGSESTVPTGKSGAQPVDEESPQEAMKHSKANVDDFTCVGFEDVPRRLPPSRVTDKIRQQETGNATLLYEIWDAQQRKMRITIPSAIPKKKWTHICITAKSMDSFRPDIAVYIDGQENFIQPSGWLPQASYTNNNYLGKSNWENTTSQYENKDELFKGSLFDFRAYNVNLSDDIIKKSFTWGKDKLGLLD